MVESPCTSVWYDPRTIPPLRIFFLGKKDPCFTAKWLLCVHQAPGGLAHLCPAENNFLPFVRFLCEATEASSPDTEVQNSDAETETHPSTKSYSVCLGTTVLVRCINTRYRKFRNRFPESDHSCHVTKANACSSFESWKSSGSLEGKQNVIKSNTRIWRESRPFPFSAAFVQA